MPKSMFVIYLANLSELFFNSGEGFFSVLSMYLHNSRNSVDHMGVLSLSLFFHKQATYAFHLGLN